MSKKRMDYTWNRSRQKKYDTCGRHLYMDGKKKFQEKKRITNHLYLVLLVPFQEENFFNFSGSGPTRRVTINLGNQSHV